MSKTVEEMQREVIAYAMEEMRNRGIEEAAQIVLPWKQGGYVLAQRIRELKRDPAAKLTDWWGPQYVADFAPIGA